MDELDIGDLSDLHLSANGVESDLFDGVTAEPDGYDAQTRTIADALIDEPDTPQLVDGVMDVSGVNMFIGLPGALKSLLAMDMGVSCAVGDNWLPSLPGHGHHPGFATKQCGVLWVDQDNGGRRVRRRLAALCRARGVTDGPFYYLSFPSPPMAAGSRVGLSALTPAVRSLGCGLVIFDTYLSVAGVKDENSSENQAAMNAFHRLADTTGATVVVIHHPTKMGNEDDLKSVRGHGSISGGLDYAFSVTRPDKGDVVVVTSIKDRDAKVSKFAALWSFEPDPDQPRNMLKGRFWRADVPDKKRDALDAMRDQILKMLPAGPMHTNAIIEALGRNRNDVVALLATMMQERTIFCEAGRRGAKVYRLP